MQFDELRNAVEHSAAILKDDPDADRKEAEAVSEAVLVFGQSIVGIFERLDSIAKSLEKIANPVYEIKPPLPSTFEQDS
jgi:hypothetical protein